MHSMIDVRRTSSVQEACLRLTNFLQPQLFASALLYNSSIFSGRRWVQHVELRRIRQAGGSYASACVRSIVVGVAQPDFRVQQEPMCAWRPKWHALATGINDTCFADRAANCMCVWPQTTTSALAAPNIGNRIASGVREVKIS
jgi:hypothetical protein